VSPLYTGLDTVSTTGATAAGIIALSEVIFTFLGAWLWFDEGLNLVQIIGSAIVLVGIILTQMARVNEVIGAGP
jgi:drug/metabolite transporter (DMT)-like permease